MSFIHFNIKLFVIAIFALYLIPIEGRFTGSHDYCNAIDIKERDGEGVHGDRSEVNYRPHFRDEDVQPAQEPVDYVYEETGQKDGMDDRLKKAVLNMKYGPPVPN